MGLFDSVIMTCPSCSAPIEVQSKAGDCVLESYSETSVPAEIAASIMGEHVYCTECDDYFRVETEVVSTVVCRLVKSGS